MSDKLVILSLLCMVGLSSCSHKENPEIRAACEAGSAGNYLIKWETFPPIEGTVKIYESGKPDSFNVYSPIAEQHINVGYKTVFAMHGLERSYFQLIFNKEYSVITAERVIRTDRIINMRDLGGYYNREKKQTRWGKLYRSGTLSYASPYDVEILNNLNIQTIIDFRTDKESYRFPSKYKAPQVFNLPLNSPNTNLFFDKILSGEMKKGDVIILSQDVHAYLLENNSEYFKKMFEILLEEKNYPVLMFCSIGKERSGIAAALVLAALDVNEDQIMQDYMSNDNIDPDMLVDARGFSDEVQETLTALYSTNKESISYVLNKITKDYGSFNNYFEKELGLTAKKREKLKDLLLYQQINRNKP